MPGTWKIDHAATAAQYEANAADDLAEVNGEVSEREAHILTERAQVFATLAQSHRIAELTEQLKERGSYLGTNA